MARATPKPAIQVDGGNDRLHGIGKNRIFTVPAGEKFTLTKENVAADVKGAGYGGQLAFIDHVGTDSGQISFLQIRITLHQNVSNGEIQYGVSEKLESFVVSHFRVALLVHEGAVA